MNNRPNLWPSVGRASAGLGGVILGFLVVPFGVWTLIGIGNLSWFAVELNPLDSNIVAFDHSIEIRIADVDSGIQVMAVDDITGQWCSLVIPWGGGVGFLSSTCGEELPED